MPLIPVGSHIVIRRSSAAEVSRGGIVLPEHAKEKPKEGTVLAVGPGKILERGRQQVMQLAVGDRVLFTSHAGTDLRVAGTDLVVMEEDDVLAVLESRP